MCVFYFCAGKTTIGTVNAACPQDIVIQGTGVEDEHCHIVNNGQTVTLYPIATLCAVDGLHICKPTQLSQGKSRKKQRQVFFNRLLVHFKIIAPLGALIVITPCYSSVLT